MADGASAWRGRAAVARSMGDEATAEWCDAQAEHHERGTEMARQYADTACLKGSPEHG